MGNKRVSACPCACIAAKQLADRENRRQGALSLVLRDLYDQLRALWAVLVGRLADQFQDLARREWGIAGADGPTDDKARR